MTTAFQNAGAAIEPSAFAPLHTNRIFTGLWTNRSALRDASASAAMERAGYGRQDAMWDGLNVEISTRLTMVRRCGNSSYNTQTFPVIKRFYSFNWFTLTSEGVSVIADTATDVYDATGPGNKTLIWHKSAGAGSTYFCSIGNNLYFTNGVDNKIWVYDPATGTGTIYDWGIETPVNAPTATQQPRPNPYPPWSANTGYATYVEYGGTPGNFFNDLVLRDSNGNIQRWGPFESPSTYTGQLGAGEPVWQTALAASTPDGTISWTCQGSAAWQARSGRGLGELCVASIAGLPDQLFATILGGNTGAETGPPNWADASGVGQQVQEGDCIWQNLGPVLSWGDLGANCPVSHNWNTTDAGGYLQTVYQMGKSGAAAPAWQELTGALTIDNKAIWLNSGPFAVPTTDPVQYGYAFKNSATKDIGEMSPPSNPIKIVQGNEVVVTGDAPTLPGEDVVIIYRTAQGGSTFFYLDEIPAPPVGGAKWTYIDNKPDSELNVAIQAQVNGEGTPLPEGATCIEYHLGRLFVAVGNVVYVASGPDAVASTSGGQAGFATTLTAQSKITRFWVTPIGLIVFTVRDSYIILGSATDNDPLYMVKFIARLPLLSYDCMTEQNTTAFLFLGTRMIVGLDPSSGILEASFQISNVVSQYDPASSYLTFHSESSSENALYLSDGISKWNRMAPTSAPESGANWSPTANIQGGFSAVQSVEVTPGVFRLLLGTTFSTGRIRYRDVTVNTDIFGIGHTPTPYPAWATFGSITLASPGQLAAIAFITLDSEKIGTAAALSVLMNEVNPSKVPFESLKRTRQDPPLLPPAETLYSDRFSLLQKQRPVWCRHFQMRIDWPAENAANELIGFTIFGQLWQEYRSQ